LDQAGSADPLTTARFPKLEMPFAPEGEDLVLGTRVEVCRDVRTIDGFPIAEVAA
jgi:hypothetical protein